VDSIIYPYIEGIKMARQVGVIPEIEEAKLEIAVKMLEDKEPKEKVSKWTGLDIGLIELIIRDLGFEAQRSESER
jgi:hypothetical protein